MPNLLMHTEAVADEDGVIVLKGVPVHRGQKIEVTVYAVEDPGLEAEDPLTLRKETLHDEDFFEPVAVDDWEALR